MILAQTAPLLAPDTGDANLVGRCVLPKLLEDARVAVDIDNAMLLGAQAEWLVSRGAFATAQADLRLALRVFPCALPTLGPVLVAAARHLDASELEGVAGLAERSLAESDNEANRATLLLVRAVVAARTGRGAEAGVAALEAAGLAERNGWPLFAARALEVAGRIETAREFYARCGASAGVARCGGAAISVTAGPADSLLSAREMEVARLVALGLTNKVISERLAVGMKTVEKHMASIFRKLDVTSRVHVAAYVLEQAPGGEAGAAASS
jgi:DNA-binding CsgD family transcriptional regulator